MPAKKKTEEAEVIGPFDEDRYLPTLGITLEAGKTHKVTDDDGGNQ